MGSLDEYVAHQDGSNLAGYIENRLEGYLKVESAQLLKKELNEFMANFKCPNCGATKESFMINYNQLVCKNCDALYEIPCPRCKTGLRVNETGDYVTEYRCPSCKLTIKTDG